MAISNLERVAKKVSVQIQGFVRGRMWIPSEVEYVRNLLSRVRFKDYRPPKRRSFGSRVFDKYKKRYNLS
jgi:hypothetical protein